ncbi:MAG: hypothetical protein KTR28_02025 [Micavibrio sp.]|nr:hypothetical protein [Micavibrio sp.]
MNEEDESSVEDASSSMVKSEESNAVEKEKSLNATVEVSDRKDKLAKKLQKKIAQKEKAPADELTSVLKSGRIAEKKKKKKKLAIQGAAALFGVFVVFQLYDFLFSTQQAPVTYGICRVYMELQVKFPSELKFVGLENFGANVRVWYTRTDPFGGQHLENIRCYFARSAERGSYIEKIEIDRREEPRDKVERFNKVLPVVSANLPSLNWPSSDTGKSVQSIIVDSATVRKSIF